jgi:Domain of unknown function (DUF4277)
MCQAVEQEVAVEEGVGKEADVAERLDHLGIVAGVCREIGLAEWLDAQDSQSHERVSVGTATMAMILNGLGFSNRRLYLVPQFFATKAVERLLGPGITADDLTMTTVWDAPWIGCTPMIRRHGLPASHCGRDAPLGSARGRCTWTPPRLR